MASTVNSELYNATLLIAKFENKVDCLQLASFAGCKTTLLMYLVTKWVLNTMNKLLIGRDKLHVPENK